jgi:site-specific DNA-methyltransferase (adenine-specific)
VRKIMKLYSESNNYKLYQGNMLDMLDFIEPNSIDAIVTDPPYELGFMSKSWDSSGIAFQKETWEKCLKVLKPGGYLLSFGGSRTHHRVACAIEDAGFEIRDCIMYMFGSGFPKSMNISLAIDKKNGVEPELGGVKPGHEDFVDRTTDGDTRFENGMEGFDRPWMHDDEKREQYHYEKLPTSDEAKQWKGWGTQLKPAYEAIIVARKPCEGSITDNVLKYGVGGINIDECRVGCGSGNTKKRYVPNNKNNVYGKGFCGGAYENINGRFPSNVVLTYDETDFEEVCGGMPYTKSTGGSGETSKRSTLGNFEGGWKHEKDCANLRGLGDEGSAARYFYCAKASKKDRDEGLDCFDVKSTGELQGRKEGSAGSVMNPLRPDGHIRNNPLNPYAGAGGIKRNSHPTVKPTSLMQYLIRLVTPKGGTVLDPFNGSGSTGKACMWENKERSANYKYIGIELTPEYLPISKARIDYVEQADSIQELESKSKSSGKPTTNTSTVIKLFDIPQG